MGLTPEGKSGSFEGVWGSECRIFEPDEEDTTLGSSYTYMYKIISNSIVETYLEYDDTECKGEEVTKTSMSFYFTLEARESTDDYNVNLVGVRVAFVIYTDEAVERANEIKYWNYGDWVKDTLLGGSIEGAQLYTRYQLIESKLCHGMEDGSRDGTSESARTTSIEDDKCLKKY